MEPYRVFISYAHEDRSLAEVIAAQLRCEESDIARSLLKYYEKRVDDRLIPRFPGDGPKCGYLGPNS